MRGATDKKIDKVQKSAAQKNIPGEHVEGMFLLGNAYEYFAAGTDNSFHGLKPCKIPTDVSRSGMTIFFIRWFPEFQNFKLI